MGSRLAQIFVGGERPNPRVAPHLSRDAETIAADSGWAHAVSLGFPPDVLVGDMDSIEPTDLEEARASSCDVIEFPVDKDLTDAEIAVQVALERGCTEIVVVSGGGDRFDHVVAMLHSLAGVDADVTAFIGAARIRFCSPARGCTLVVEPGRLVSLIPVGGDATGVHTEGLKWNLRDDTLHGFESRGVSNVAIASLVAVSVVRGRLAVVQPDYLED